MSPSGAGKPDLVLEGMELLFHQKGGSASFGAKMVLSLNGVDPGCMNSITVSTCRAKCSNILHDICLSGAFILLNIKLGQKLVTVNINLFIIIMTHLNPVKCFSIGLRVPLHSA